MSGAVCLHFLVANKKWKKAYLSNRVYLKDICVNLNDCCRWLLLSMTSGSENIDVLVKEYLIFRGFIQAAKHFDVELRGDKDKGFRVSKVFWMGKT